MSDSIPNTLRTEMRVSGRPGVGSAAVGVCLEFMGPPRFFPHGKQRFLVLLEFPSEAKAGYPTYGGRNRCASDQLVGAKIVIGLNDLAQFILRRPVAAIRVRMVAFDQVLVAGLDPGLGRVAV